MEESSRDSTSVAGTLAFVTGAFAQLGAAVIGLSAVAYLIGWRQASAYFRIFRTPWVVNEFPPTRLLLESAGLTTSVAFLAFVAVMNVTVGNWKHGVLKRVADYSSLFAGLVYLVSLALDRWFISSVVRNVGLGASLLCSIAAGFAIARLVVAIRESKLMLQRQHFWLTYTVIFVALWQAPDVAGMTYAERDADPETSTLPILRSAHEVGNWRLLTTFDGSYLLVRLATNAEMREFRVVKDLDAWTMSPSK